MKKVNITTICEIQVGKTPSRYNDSYWGHGSPWLSIADMNQGLILEKTKETITEKAIKECNCKLIPQNTVLFSFKLSIGKVGIAKIPIYTNEAIAAFIIKDHSKLDTKFLFYALKSVDHSIGSNKAVMGKTLNKEQLKKIEIPLPPLKDQKRIVKILDAADALCQKRKQAITLLDDYLQSSFLQISQKSKQIIKLKLLIKDSKGSARTGPFGSDLKHSEFVDSGVAVIGIDNAVKNKFEWKERRFITDQKYQKLKRYTIFPRDVIITIMGTVGRSAVIPSDIPLSINTKHLAALTLDESKANPYFISYAVHSDPRIKRQIIGNSRGAIMSGLNLGIIKNLELPDLGIEDQNRFEQIYLRIESIKQKMLIQSQELETGFQALMQKAFKGEL